MLGREVVEGEERVEIVHELLPRFGIVDELVSKGLNVVDCVSLCVGVDLA